MQDLEQFDLVHDQSLNPNEEEKYQPPVPKARFEY